MSEEFIAKPEAQFEDDLRAALGRTAPRHDLSEAILRRIATEPRRRRRWARMLSFVPGQRKWLPGVAAACVVAIIAGGVGMQRRRAAERAQQQREAGLQLIRALQIAGAPLAAAQRQLMNLNAGKE